MPRTHFLCTQEAAAKQQELKESLTVEQELRERTEQRLADIQAGHDKNVLQLKEVCFR